MMVRKMRKIFSRDKMQEFTYLIKRNNSNNIVSTTSEIDRKYTVKQKGGRNLYKQGSPKCAIIYSLTKVRLEVSGILRIEQPEILSSKEFSRKIQSKWKFILTMKRHLNDQGDIMKAGDLKNTSFFRLEKQKMKKNLRI